MHIVRDENGNLCPHGHSHEEEHSHHHGHDHGECESCNGCEEKSPREKLTALLGYMLAHNESHAAELDEMAGKLTESGMEEAAEQIRKGVAEFQKGNLYLSLALSMVKESE